MDKHKAIEVGYGNVCIYISKASLVIIKLGETYECGLIKSNELNLSTSTEIITINYKNTDDVIKSIARLNLVSLVDGSENNSCMIGNTELIFTGPNRRKSFEAIKTHLDTILHILCDPYII